MNTKTCIVCLAELPETEFYLKSRTGGRRQSRCKSCASVYMKNYIMTEPPGKRQRRLSLARTNWFKNKYGITVADYDRMLASQGGKCASCGNAPAGKGCAAILNVDHDHETGVVRGLLCNPCNQALGFLRDDPDVIWGLLLYARRHQRPRLQLVA